MAGVAVQITVDTVDTVDTAVMVDMVDTVVIGKPVIRAVCHFAFRLVSRPVLPLMLQYMPVSRIKEALAAHVTDIAARDRVLSSGLLLCVGVKC
jgi:hypothetical protein